MKKKPKKSATAPQVKAGIDISYCTFYGTKWDEKSLEAVILVAKGLNTMAELFKAVNGKIEINQGGIETGENSHIILGKE